MSCNRRHNANGQHDNISNPIDYATQANYQENLHVRTPPHKDTPEQVFRLLYVNLNGISIT